MKHPSMPCVPLCEKGICVRCDQYRIYFYDSAMRTTKSIVAENRVLLKQVMFLKEELVKALTDRVEVLMEGGKDE